MFKKCSKCQTRKRLVEFNFKDKAKDRRNSQCRQCTRKSIMAAYYKNRAYYIQYRTKRNLEQRQEISRFLYAYLKQHPCADCGISDPVVLEFDHVRGKKIMAVSLMVRRRYSLKIIVAEIKKCQVRCSNCHARKTARDFNQFFHVLNEANSLLLKQKA